MKTFILLIFPILLPSAVLAESTKLWATDWISYRNTSLADDIRGQSSRACLSETEALTEASRDAAKQLLDLMNLPQRQDAVRMLATSIQQGRLIKDRSMEKIERPYGVLYQSLLLIDASEKSLAPFKRQIESMLRKMEHRQRERSAAKVILTAASVAGFSLLCMGANFFTRGYFTWRLRLASFVAIIASLGGIYSLL